MTKKIFERLKMSEREEKISWENLIVLLSKLREEENHKTKGRKIPMGILRKIKNWWRGPDLNILGSFATIMQEWNSKQEELDKRHTESIEALETSIKTIVAAAKQNDEIIKTITPLVKAVEFTIDCIDKDLEKQMMRDTLIEIAGIGYERAYSDGELLMEKARRTLSSLGIDWCNAPLSTDTKDEKEWERND